MKKILGNRGMPVNRQIFREVVAMAWPAALEGALLSIISSVDTIMVQAVSEFAIASVSLTAQPRLILLILAQSLCVGTTALIARRKGENDRATACSVLGQSMAIITVIGIAITLIGYFFAPTIMDWSGADADTREMSVAYCRIVSLGFLFNCWNLCLCAGLRAVGNTRITMITNITANVVNVFFNYCLISGRLGFPAMGVKGAALATDIGYFVAFCISLWFVRRPRAFLRLEFRRLKFDRGTLNGLVKVGGSSIAENCCMRIGFFINMRMIADIGAVALTAYTVVQQVTSLSYTLGDGISAAGAALVGQALGAKDKERAKQYVTGSRFLAFLVSLVLMVGIYLLRNTLPAVFTQDPVIIAGAGLAFIVAAAGMIPQNARTVYSGCLRGAGDVRFVALVSLISVATIRPILTWLFCYPVNAALPGWQFAYTGPWLAFLLDAIVRQILLFIRVRNGKYLEIRL